MKTVYEFLDEGKKTVKGDPANAKAEKHLLKSAKKSLKTCKTPAWAKDNFETFLQLAAKQLRHLPTTVLDKYINLLVIEKMENDGHFWEWDDHLKMTNKLNASITPADYTKIRNNFLTHVDKFTS